MCGPAVGYLFASAKLLSEDHPTLHHSPPQPAFTEWNHFQLIPGKLNAGMTAISDLVQLGRFALGKSRHDPVKSSRATSAFLHPDGSVDCQILGKCALQCHCHHGTRSSFDGAEIVT